MIPQLASQNSCTGCAACHDSCPRSAIRMEYDDEGFLKPVIQEKLCIECMGCVRICPILNYVPVISEYKQRAYISWNKHSGQRKHSSSGGIFPVLANYILQQNGVVVGAAYQTDMSVKLVCVEKQVDLMNIIGSKYLQSDATGVYRYIKKILDGGRDVLFSGLPCQIAGLRSYLCKDYDHLFTCELMCHGAPSPGIFQDYVKYLQKDGKKQVINIDFRNKLISWKRPCVKISYRHHHANWSFQAGNEFFTWFGLHLSVRKSCFECRFRTPERHADLTVGDFWGIDTIAPELPVKKGVSALLVNTSKGNFLVHQVEQQLFLRESRFEDIIKKNPYLIANYNLPAERDSFFALWHSAGIAGLRLSYPEVSVITRLIHKIKRLLKR